MFTWPIIGLIIQRADNRSREQNLLCRMCSVIYRWFFSSFTVSLWHRGLLCCIETNTAEEKIFILATATWAWHLRSAQWLLQYSVFFSLHGSHQQAGDPGSAHVRCLCFTTWLRDKSALENRKVPPTSVWGGKSEAVNWSNPIFLVESFKILVLCSLSGQVLHVCGCEDALSLSQKPP